MTRSFRFPVDVAPRTIYQYAPFLQRPVINQIVQLCRCPPACQLRRIHKMLDCKLIILYRLTLRHLDDLIQDLLPQIIIHNASRVRKSSVFLNGCTPASSPSTISNATSPCVCTGTLRVAFRLYELSPQYDGTITSSEV